MTQKSIALSIIIAGALIGGVFLFATRAPATGSVDNVSVSDGKQIVEITAKGKYTPPLTDAKAGMPTILRVKTNGTFDCTAGLKIPSMGYQKFLPPSGTTDIEVPAQQAGASVRGVCVMGMYNFNVRFN